VAAVRVSGEVSEAGLVAFCKERLGASYPRYVMIAPDFPRNPMGKPLKRELAKMMIARGDNSRVDDEALADA
jgi:acyl-coenzyme A synthetase/AMP-(fatty) acid ligase